MSKPLQELIGDLACRNDYELLAGIVYVTRPERVLELGTGDGYSGDVIMTLLAEDSTFTTINWPNPPSGDDVGCKLVKWKDDPRLTQILGDTRDVADQVSDGIDTLFIDSGTDHNYDLIAAEWALYSPKLADKALVCVDGLDFPGGGIRRFWDALPYEKVETKLSTYGFGVFRYRSSIATLLELIGEVSKSCENSYALLGGLVFCTQAKNVLGLVAGDHAVKAIMQLLPKDSTFTAIDWPDETPESDGGELAKWKDDPRLHRIFGDILEVADEVRDGVDLLVIRGWDIESEWPVYAPKLADKAIVCVDALILSPDTQRFWNALTYEKVIADWKLNTLGFGVFRYSVEKKP